MDPHLAIAQRKLAKRQAHLEKEVCSKLPSKYAPDQIETEHRATVQNLANKTVQFEAGLEWQKRIIPDPFSKQKLVGIQDKIGFMQLVEAETQIKIIEARRTEYSEPGGRIPAEFEGLLHEGNEILKEAQSLKDMSYSQETLTRMPPGAAYHTAFDTRWVGLGGAGGTGQINARPQPINGPPIDDEEDVNVTIFAVGITIAGRPGGPPGEHIEMQGMTRAAPLPNPHLNPPPPIPTEHQLQLQKEAQDEAVKKMKHERRMRIVKIVVAVLLLGASAAILFIFVL